MNSAPIQGWNRSSSFSGITDSAAAATALATGELTLNGHVGLDRNKKKKQSIIEFAVNQGFKTAVISTTSLSHATPAAFISYGPERYDHDTINPHVFKSPVNLLLGGGLEKFKGPVPNHFLAIETLDQLNSEKSESQIIGTFYPDHFPYVAERPTEHPNLSDMSLAALNFLGTRSEKILLVVEGGRIDHGGHQNNIQNVIGETLEFDTCIEDIVKWNRGRNGFELLVTADHETGGLTILKNLGKDHYPEVSWRWKNHTNKNVPLYAWGSKSSLFQNALAHHTAINQHLKNLIHNKKETKLTYAGYIPDGYLDDSIYLNQTTTNIKLAHNDHGLGIGLLGIHPTLGESIVILIDRDYGSGTGLRDTHRKISDRKGIEDKLLSRFRHSQLKKNKKWGAEYAVVSVDGADSSFNYQVDGASLLGFTKKSSYSRLTHQNIAINYGQTEGHSDKMPGMEIFIPWNRLYPIVSLDKNKKIGLALYKVETATGNLIESFGDSSLAGQSNIIEYTVSSD